MTTLTPLQRAYQITRQFTHQQRARLANAYVAGMDAEATGAANPYPEGSDPWAAFEVGRDLEREAQS